MYDISFTVGFETLRLNSDSGIYVSTISGLTGVTASFSTVQNASGSGVSVASSSVGSKILTVKGYILDGETEVKQTMLDFFKPGQKMTMFVNSNKTSSDTRAIYGAHVVVKSSPEITQEKHSQFVLDLLMPIPFWERTDFLTVPLGTEYTVLGDAEPEFELKFKMADNGVESVALWAVDATTFKQQSFLISLVENGSPIAEIGDSIRIWREDGIIKASLNGSEKMSMLFAESTMWYLPLRNQTFLILPSGKIADASLTYKPIYSGVLVDGT